MFSSVLAPFTAAMTWLYAGGPVLMILAGLSVLSLTVILFKSWQFIMLRIEATAFINKAFIAWRGGDWGQVEHVLQSTSNPAAPILHTALTGVLAGNVREDLLREECQRQGAHALHKLRSGLRILEVIAAISPLLGLLGTVVGMIDAFQALASASGAQADPKALSEGIWQALLTTAAGLAVAIPTVVALNALERIIERFTHHVEDALTRAMVSPLPENKRNSSVVPTPLRIRA